MTLDVKTITAAIRSAKADWQSEENFLTSMSLDERQLFLGYSPGPGEPTLQETEKAAKASFAAKSAVTAPRAAAPAAFDLRNVGGKNYVTSVKNQGSCGSCVSFGSVATVEGTIRWRRDLPDLAIDLSEAHLFYCHAHKQGRNCGNGWWVPPALDAFRDLGVSDEACYPYVAGDQNCSNLCNDWQNRAVKITAWHEVSTASAMKDWLSTKGPLAACFTVYDDFFTYKTGVYRHVSGALAGGHCICCVGYDDVAGCWICKNSWSDSWGDKGYFRIAYGDCGIDARMWAVDVAKQEATPTWLKNKLVTGLWAINEKNNAAVYIDGTGWCKITADTDTAFLAILNVLSSAKVSKSPVNLRIENSVIMEAYVF